ncbi:MAG: hypothetical protein LBF58_03830 [Deltaproteobacteria bacterium]|jgi:hypothetical protein|nr:hypothetical protein [Deltaproteobacteria bacterium]
MQIDSNNNYNTLGRMGPIYPRPEYRPKYAPKDNPEESKAGQDKVNVSGGRGEKAKDRKGQKELTAQSRAQAQPAVPEGRLNLQTAKTLTKVTAEAIAGLPPDGRNQGPHAVQGLGLLAPRYV